MSLDLGALVGRVILETTSFDRTYTRVVRQFSELGSTAERSAAGAATLDESLTAVGASANTTTAAITRTTRSVTASASAEEKATAAARQHAAAVARVAEVMAPLAGATTREQQAALRLAAAQDRVNAAQESGRVTTRSLASAQAGLIAAQDRATAAAGPSRFAGALGGSLKTAGELGLVVGALEGVKKAIDITKEANDFQRSMVQVQTNADVTAAEVHRASAALLAMAGPVAAAPADLATAWYHAKSVGLDYAKSLDTTRIAAMGARVGNGDLEETMNALTSTVASGIPGVKDMSSAMGQLIAIVGSGDMKLSDLNAALGGGILSVVKGYGLSLTDVGAALATFGDNNIRGADAATMLRMAVQAMAVPAKAGAKELDRLGLSATQLRDDMQQGGLNKAILDLKAHLDAAHVSSSEVGGVLTEVFGKRAGPGLQVLIGQVDRLESKFAILRDSGTSFGDKWKATTDTASFALARLGHGLEAAGIKITEQLGPDIARVANWLGAVIPSAIHNTEQAVGPLAHLLGGVLSTGLHVVGAALSVVVSALSEVSALAASSSGVISDLGTAALVTWAAFKGVGLAVVGLKALDGALLTAKIRAVALADSFTAVAAGEEVMSLGAMAFGFAAVGVAVYAAGKTISSWVDAGSGAVYVTENLTRVQGDFRAALDASNGALNEQVQRTVGAELQHAGLAASAEKAGISLRDLITATTGGADATAELLNRWKATGKLTDSQAVELIALANTYSATSADAKDLAGSVGKVTSATSKQIPVVKQAARQMQWNIDAHGQLVQTSVKAGSALDNTTAAMARQTTASSILKNALDYLNGVNETVEQTTDAFSIGLGQLRNQTALAQDANGNYSTSLKQSSVAGAQNRQVLVGLIDAAKAQAQATADQAAKHHGLAAALKIGNSQLATNEAAIRRAAKAAGLNKQEVDQLISSMGKLSHVKVAPKADLNDAASPKLAAIQAKMDSLRQHETPVLNVDTYAAEVKVAALQAQMDRLTGNSSGGGATTGSSMALTGAGRAAGGGLPNGWAAVGEKGAELTYTSGGKTHVFSHSQSRAILTATGMHAPGFAGGTTPAMHTSTSSGSKTGNIVDTATLPGVSGIAELIHGQTGPAATAMRMLSQAVNDAFNLKGIESELGKVQGRIKSMTSYKSGITQTLSGSFDATKYGSVLDLVGGIHGATATNKAYTGEVDKLRGEAKGNKTLTAFINQLAASGQTATLDTLAQASRGQLKQVSAAEGAYNQQLNLAGNAAVYAKYGSTISAQQARADQLTAERKAEVASIDKLVAAIGKLTNRPVEVKIGGEVVAKAVVKSNVFTGVLDELSHTLHYGRNHH